MASDADLSDAYRSDEMPLSDDGPHEGMARMGTETDLQLASSDSLRVAMQALEGLEGIGTNLSETIREPRDKLISLLREQEQQLTRRMRARFERSATKVKGKIKSFEDSMAKRRNEFRKRITGDDTKSVRDHLREKRKQPPIIRLIDKLTFTGGVANMLMSQFVLLKSPELFWGWYCLVIPVLLYIKYVYYKSLRWHYFMLDFCYFANLCCLFHVIFMPISSSLTQVIFLFGNGPLAMAIPVWKNSLVFHDIDRVSSTYIHLFPALLSFTLRWYPISNGPQLLARFYSQTTPAWATENAGFLNWYHLVLATLLYLAWQVAYLIKTEVLDRAVFEADPKLQTSLIWMSSDTKNPTANFVLKQCKKCGVFAPNEQFNSRQLKTKLVFVGSQFVYTFGAFLLAILAAQGFWIHTAFLVWLVGVAVHNGASYYIEVFSRRYAKKFEGVDGDWLQRSNTPKVDETDDHKFD